MSTKDKSPVFMIGAILFIVGGGLGGLKMYMEWDGVTVMGTVTAVSERRETDSTGTITNYYDPTISFVIESGDSASGELSNNKEPFRYEPGRQVEIVYQRDDVSRIFEANSFLWYLPCVAVMVLGVFVMRLSFKLKSEGWDG